MANIAQIQAKRKFKLDFTDGLVDKLGTHIESKHGKKVRRTVNDNGHESEQLLNDIELKNGRLADELTDRAVEWIPRVV